MLFKWLLSLLFVVVPQVSSSQTVARMAIIGDAGEAGVDLDKLRESLNSVHVKSLIMPGDNLYEGTYESVWDTWKYDGFSFDVVAIGNHNDGYEKEIRYFGMPNQYYSVLKNGARFIVLNSDNTKNVGEQIGWLDRELAKATESLIFLVYHHPTFTISRNHEWYEKKEFQVNMRDIFRKYHSKITAVLLGHDHITAMYDFGSIPAIVSGSGREVRKSQPVSYTADGFDIETRFMAPLQNHWSLLEIQKGAREALVHFISVESPRAICSARLTRGRMLLEGACAR